MPEGENVQKMLCFWVFALPAKGEEIAWQLDQWYWVNILLLSVGGNAAGTKC